MQGSEIFVTLEKKNWESLKEEWAWQKNTFIKWLSEVNWFAAYQTATKNWSWNVNQGVFGTKADLHLTI